MKVWITKYAPTSGIEVCDQPPGDASDAGSIPAAARMGNTNDFDTSDADADTLVYTAAEIEALRGEYLADQLARAESWFADEPYHELFVIGGEA